MYIDHISHGCKKISLLLLLATGILFCFSCKKFLDKKNNLSLAIPDNLNDLQMILDNNQKNNLTPGYLELVADNYYVSGTTWNASSPNERLNYIWDKDAKLTGAGDADNNWTTVYAIIYQSNLVLELLPRVKREETVNTTYNSVQGTALFYRGYLFYQLAQLFCRPYSASAADDPGIVLRLNTSITEPYYRATVQQTYDQVIKDLKAAVTLLPVTTLFATRPGKAAAYGALARIYLSMRDYAHAGLYADSALAIRNALLDYNALKPAGNPVVPDNYLSNPEVLYLSYGGTDLLNNPRAMIDSTLYASYSGNDWRKTVFFTGYGNNTYYFRGSYFSNANPTSYFSGIATDELYLVRAECRARAGDKTGALEDLNNLLRNRFKTGTFTDLTATDAADALARVLTERRKELVYRGVRWTDLRRLNLENPVITLKRIVSGTTYTLPPNDPRWVLFIPETEINRSGITQNIR